MSEYLFTSESVSEGHPDKVADQISDAVLDAILAQDKFARVAAETLVNTGLVVMAGEITTTAVVDFQQIARETIKRIGYDNTEYGIDYKGCAVLVAYDKQSPDISQGVTEGKGLDLEQGAGDQGLMFGYACNETQQLMLCNLNDRIQSTIVVCQRIQRVRVKPCASFSRTDLTYLRCL